MSILATIFSAGQATRGASLGEKRDNSWWLPGYLLGESTTSGVTVTADTALTSAAVFACVRILAETLASLPLITYERVGKGRQRAKDFYLYPILHDEPNPWMTSFEWRETVQGHLALWGNAYNQLEYDAGGRIKTIFPLRPDRMRDIKIENGVKIYKYQLPSGETVWLNGEIIWHLKAFGDGLYGYSPVQLMKNAIGLTLGMEKFGAKFFGNGARPGGVLEHPGKLSTDAQSRLRASWNEMHQGLDNSHKVAILEEGLKWHDIGVPPEDAQYLEGRKFQSTEIARIYRVPPHMIADLEKATFSNIEHQSQEFLNYTMLPWTTRWEQSIHKHLLLPVERKRYYVEFLVDGLLRGDITARTNYYATGRNWGWLSVNDIREKENMNPVEGGDVYLQPLNMIPAGSEPPETNNNEQQLELETRWMEERTTRSVNSRRRIMLAHQSIMEELMRGLYRREIREVKPMAVKMLNAGLTTEFLTWLTKYYQEHRKWMSERSLKTFMAYMQMISGEAGEEVGRALEPERLEGFSRAYAESFSDRQAAHSESRVRTAIEEEDALEALEEEFDNWEDVRPGRSAGGEIVQQANAISKLVYLAAGVQTLRWVSSGKNCPYCDSLDGMTININQSFLVKGESYRPDGADAPLQVSVDMSHPPAHEGCDCMIAAG
jgi:HK97 family phage portal protein